MEEVFDRTFGPSSHPFPGIAVLAAPPRRLENEQVFIDGISSHPVLLSHYYEKARFKPLRNDDESGECHIEVSQWWPTRHPGAI